MPLYARCRTTAMDIMPHTDVEKAFAYLQELSQILRHKYGL